MLPTNTEEIVYRAVQMGELQIDEEGRIWRTAARKWNRWEQTTVAIACKMRRAENTKGAYLRIRVMFGLKRTYTLAHRLVWRHFNGPIPPGLTINHKNGKKKDNRPENLELATYSEQIRHAIKVLGREYQRNSLGQFSAQ